MSIVPLTLIRKTCRCDGEIPCSTRWSERQPASLDSAGHRGTGRTTETTTYIWTIRTGTALPISLHNGFKAATAARGENMTDILMQFIQNYVDKYGARRR